MDPVEKTIDLKWLKIVVVGESKHMYGKGGVDCHGAGDVKPLEKWIK